MKTVAPIEYFAAPYGKIATIPAGTSVIRAKNLPDNGEKLYWAKGWRRMTQLERSWKNSYGFLLTEKEVKNPLQ